MAAHLGAEVRTRSFGYCAWGYLLFDGEDELGECGQGYWAGQGGEEAEEEGAAINQKSSSSECLIAGCHCCAHRLPGVGGRIGGRDDPHATDLENGATREIGGSGRWPRNNGKSFS